VFGTALAHLGLGVTTLGIVGALSFGTETILAMHPGDVAAVSGHRLRFERIDAVPGPNFTENRGIFSRLDERGDAIAEIVSSKRFYPVRQMPTTEAGIETIGLSQLYLSLGDETPDGALVVRIWWKPMVTLIWLGPLAMMVAGAVSLLDRRLRVGAPSRRVVRTAPAGNAVTR
jgi:cytochrome c-type biogenesis protein CcmF